jgi:hypothetical protein
LALEGALKPLNLRTNCSEAARISSSLAGGSKLNNVLMLRHMILVPSQNKKIVMARRRRNAVRATQITRASARE